jgi:multidrug efflux pump subunit AcrA (membrane-fusion protein)
VKKEITAFLILAGTALAALSCGGGENEGATEAPPMAVVVHVVERATADSVYEASGTLRATQTAVVTSKIPGHVRELLVNAGDRVKRGQTLAVLEGQDLEARLAAAKAALQEAEDAEREASAGLEAARAGAAIAESTFRRYQELEGKRAATAQEMDEVESRALSARADLAMAEARLGRARSAIERARAEIASAQAFWGYTRIEAPFDGRVIERMADVGNLAAPGAPLLVLEQAGALRAEVFVDESQAGSVHVGDDAAVVVAGSERLKGRVSEVFPAIDPMSRAFLVKVDLPEGADSERFAPGRFVRVELRAGEAQTMRVPESAVMHRGQLELVYVVEGDRARLRLVTLGRAREGFVEVLSGLNPGDAVVVQAQQIAEEGTRVAAQS